MESLKVDDTKTTKQRPRSFSVGVKEKPEVGSTLSDIPEDVKETSLARKLTVKKAQISISEGYLSKKKIQLGRVVYVKRYFKIHETLLLYTRKDSVSCLPFVLRSSFLLLFSLF